MTDIRSKDGRHEQAVVAVISIRDQLLDCSNSILHMFYIIRIIRDKLMV